MQELVKGQKIYLGLSGGVDSAVSAALLQKAGAEVIGVYIKGWYPPGMPCTWASDRRDAMRVAAHLRIPFVTLDASAEYKKEVIDYLLSEYAAGRTPNPDVMCNRKVKFGAFYRYAMSHGTDAIATGHYRSGPKDQSYFLWAVPKEVLEKTIFPIGYMEKTKVRALAKQFGLPVAEKKDSQGVCFLGSVSVKEFLEKEFGDNPAILHTIGERVESGYVVAKDVSTGTITTSKAPVPHATTTKIFFRDANWLMPSQKVSSAQIRYRGEKIPGHIEEGAFVPSSPLAEYISPGQSIVFYDDSELLGGGIIVAS